MDTRLERSLSVLDTEKVNPATTEIDRMSPLEIVQVINDEAGTAQKMVLNMLSTGTTILLGKTFGNLMVDVQATIASLSALVFRAARAGDEIASEIVQSAADELALAAVTVRNALDFPGEEVSIALGGGLLLHEANFRAQVLRGIGKELSIRQVALVEEPALSAARAAIKLT